MDKVKFVMLVGLPGSGKSTLAKEYQLDDYKIHSSDDIREELSGDVNNQDINKIVFETLHNRIKEDLSNDINCVYDATNINWKRRRAFLLELNNIDCVKTCVVAATPYEVCVQRNNNRDRKVPLDVLKNMYMNFDVPGAYEGWDTIKIHYTKPDYKGLYGSVWNFIAETKDYEQDNPYHALTIGKHCKACGDIVYNHYKALSTTCPTEKDVYITSAAALLHDCGKPFCKTFSDTKGEPTDVAHYYKHEHVGSYNSLFYDVSHAREIALLIRWHMQPYMIEDNEKLTNKYRNLWGEEMSDKLYCIHLGDKMAK